MKNILFIGDAGCPSGFAKATHNILEHVHGDRPGDGEEYNVTVMGINYRGDPHDYPYKMFTAAPGGDAFGIGRLIWMCDWVRHEYGSLDLIILQNDGWNIPMYLQQLRIKKSNGEYGWPEHAAVPVMAIVAVDGKNFNSAWLDGVQHAIFWTQFALSEARAGGYKGPASVIPLGVDMGIYHPMDKSEIRRKRLPEQLHDAFIVGNVNRNQPRKRWDLLVKYFAKWINEKGVRDAYLYLHTAPTGDTGVDVVGLAHYYGIVDRLALVTPEVFYGVSDHDMAETYNCFDINASTTQGEGFGLTTLESMACGVPQILPDWSALGDWAKSGAWMVPCLTTHVGPPYVNVIGGVADETRFIGALDRMYRDKAGRANNAQAALETAQQPQFQWSSIGQAYLEVLSGLFETARAAEQQAKASLPSTGFRQAYTPVSKPAQQLAQEVG